MINNFQSESVKETIRQTNIEKFGVDNPNKSKEFRKKKIKTCLEKYGTEYAIQCEKIKETTKQKHFEKFGVFYSFQREDVKQKNIQINLKKRGVKYPSQNRQVYNKGLKTRLLLKYYQDSDVIYQGSYELDFLNKYFEKVNIKNGLTFKYKNDDKFYHADFYLPDFNLIVEIKSSWVLEMDKNIEKKKESVIEKGFEFILILNKNYDEFNMFLSRHCFI